MEVDVLVGCVGRDQRHVMEWLLTGREAALVWLQSDEARTTMSDAQRTAFLKTYDLQGR